MNDSKLILLGGFGRSGTTGIRELLKGHLEFTSTDRSELRILTDPGGFISLKNVFVDNWTFWRGDHAIHEFKALTKDLTSKWFGGYPLSNFKAEFCGNFEVANKQFLDNLVQSSYYGKWIKHSNIFYKLLSRLIRPKRLKMFNREIFITHSLDYSQFKEITRNYFNTLVEKKLQEDMASMYIIDEPFISQNPTECMDITGANKLIVVLRDPRDVFQSFQGRDWTPRDKDSSLNYLKSVYSCWTMKKEQLPKGLYLELKLEDIVSNFSETYKRLCQFLNIDPKDDILLNTNYSPEKSHIGRWREELSNKEQEELNNYFSKLLTQLNYI